MLFISKINANKNTSNTWREYLTTLVWYLTPVSESGKPFDLHRSEFERVFLKEIAIFVKLFLDIWDM